MGFSTEDCKKALDLNKMNLTEAALWLTENVSPEERSKPEEGGLNITGIDVSVRGPRRGDSILQTDRCVRGLRRGTQYNRSGIDVRWYYKDRYN